MAIKQSRLQTVLCENTQGGTSASSYNANNLIKLPKCKTQHDYFIANRTWQKYSATANISSSRTDLSRRVNITALTQYAVHDELPL